MKVFFQTLYFVGSLKIFCRSKDGILGSLNPGFAQIGGYFFSFLGDFGEPTILGVLFQFFFQRFSYRGSSFWSFRGLCWYNIFVFLISNLHLSLLGLFDFESCAFFLKFAEDLGVKQVIPWKENRYLCMFGRIWIAGDMIQFWHKQIFSSANQTSKPFWLSEISVCSYPLCRRRTILLEKKWKPGILIEDVWVIFFAPFIHPS